MEPHEERIDPRNLIGALRRRWPLILGCAVIAAGAAFGLSLTQTKEYEATAKLLFRDPGFDQRIFGSPVFESGIDADREAQTNVELVSLDVVATRTADALGRDQVVDNIEGKIEVSAEGQSDVVAIVATDPDRRLAARLANEFAAQFIVFRRAADRAKVNDAIHLVERKLDRLPDDARFGREGNALEDQLSSLRTLSALQTGNAELVQPAEIPEDAASPKTVRNTVLGSFLGLMLGVASALLLERLDRRVRDTDELEDLVQLPVLSTIPDSVVLGSNADGKEPLPFADAEAFRLLRTRLRYFNVDRDIRSVLVTSGSPQEGKSTVAWNLAATAAEAGTRTILLEADFHQASLAARHGLEPLPGLAELLTHQVGRERAVQRAEVSTRDDGRSSGRYLDVIAAGTQPPNPIELMESEAMAKLLEDLGQEYELVVIDTPPLSVLAYSIPLMKQVSGVIVVGRLGKTTRDDAIHLRDQLRNLNVTTLGVVANRAGKKGRRYGYGYGYYGGERKESRLPFGR